MAKRSLSFLHNCVQEISILEICYPEGAVACWILLSCLEVLRTCERYSDSSNKIQYYCLFTASLWAYAREKLMELGEQLLFVLNFTGLFVAFLIFRHHVWPHAGHFTHKRATAPSRGAVVRN